VMEPQPDESFNTSRNGRLAKGKISIQLNAREFLPARDEKDLQRFITAAILEHGRLLTAGGEAVRKNAPESSVTLVALSEFPLVCVKQFRWRGWVHALKGLLRPTQGVRTYRNGMRLNNLGIRTPIPLALARETVWGLATSEWIVMEVIPKALELDRYLVKKMSEAWTLNEKRRAIRAFGRFMGSIHKAGIFHSDLKTCNILVSEQSPVRSEGSTGNRPDDSKGDHKLTFALLDFDDVSFSGTISERQRIKNLVQVFLSTPVFIDAADRMLWLREYVRNAGLTESQRRKIVRSVLEAARGREILYVGFEGDKIERWESGRYPE